MAECMQLTDLCINMNKPQKYTAALKKKAASCKVKYDAIYKFPNNTKPEHLFSTYMYTYTFTSAKEYKRIRISTSGWSYL